jgi:DNA-binding CsgD family transcriptional regulator
VAANISIVASRSLSTFTWIVLVTTISRYSLEPFRAFGIGMLVVSQLPWLLAFAASMALTALVPQATDNISTIAIILAILLMGGVTAQAMLLYAQNQRAGREYQLVGRESQLVDRERQPVSHEHQPAAKAEAPANRLLVFDDTNGSTVEADGQNALALLAQDHHLTGREAEVIGLMLAGRTLPEIADEFVLSINTVRTHYGHAYQKLAINKKRELFDLFESYLRAAAAKRQPTDNNPTANGER